MYYIRFNVFVNASVMKTISFSTIPNYLIFLKFPQKLSVCAPAVFA